jgi:hypothetical protein
MQPSGNLVLEDSNGSIKWQTNTTVTATSSRYILQLTNNGYISIINANGTSIWNSPTQSITTTTNSPKPIQSKS